MMTKLQKILIAFATLLLIAACSSATKRQFDPSVFAGVRTIELKDATDPVLLASTGAKQVSTYLEVGLGHLGYSICRDCKSDAVATVTVDEYSTKQTTKRDWLGWGNVNYAAQAESNWTLTITRNGGTIYQKQLEDRELMSIDQLAGQQVQDALREIPARQKE